MLSCSQSVDSEPESLYRFHSLAFAAQVLFLSLTNLKGTFQIDMQVLASTLRPARNL